jgi:hypothetical protein
LIFVREDSPSVYTIPFLIFHLWLSYTYSKYLLFLGYGRDHHVYFVFIRFIHVSRVWGRHRFFYELPPFLVSDDWQEHSGHSVFLEVLRESLRDKSNAFLRGATSLRISHSRAKQEIGKPSDDDILLVLRCHSPRDKGVPKA